MCNIYGIMGLSMSKELTPAMQQYVDMKKQYADCLLLFRMGDFYETFFEDAKVAAKVLDIVLTSKNKNSENPIPMAGIPFHSVEKYIDKLVKHGYKIAIAEQVSDPVPGKLVERKVQSIVTPGTYLGEEQKQFSYICAVTSSDHTNGTHYHCSWGDVSIGSFQTQSFESLDSLLQVLLRLQPKEIVLDYNFPDLQDVQARIQQYLRCMMSVYNVPLNAEQYVCDLCGVQTINSYGKALLSGRLEAFALLLHYLSYTQNSSTLFVSGVRFANDDGQMLLDDTTIKNLEILASSYE